jgi:hypothetical protein
MAHIRKYENKTANHRPRRAGYDSEDVIGAGVDGIRADSPNRAVARNDKMERCTIDLACALAEV